MQLCVHIQTDYRQDLILLKMIAELLFSKYVLIKINTHK